MTNTNCLENIKCPACGNEDTFRITGTSIFTVTDDGTEDHGDVEWDDDSDAECVGCHHHGTLKDFAGHVSVPEPSLVPADTDLPDRFDGYEIHGVREYHGAPFGQGKYSEQVPDEEAQFWSVFGHIPGRGLECVGDFESRELAEEIYARITGRRYGRPS
jgi:hypothetical protein